MASNLARILKTDMPRLPLRKAAEQLRKKGRGKDTMLAHITPREAAMLKAKGGSGTINPDTGLPEFDDGFDFSGFNFSLPTDVSAGVQAGIDTAATTPSPYGSLDTTPFDQSLTQPSPAAYNMALGNTFQLPSDTYAGIEAGIPLEAAPRSTTDPFATLAQRGYGDIPSNVLAYAGQTTQTTPTGKVAYEDTPEGIAAAEKAAAAELEGQPIDLTTKTPATSGFQTPLGSIGAKELIAALGLGGLGLNYMNAQKQGKSTAAALQAAYQQAADQTKALAQPYMQQGGQALATTLQGALTPASQQAYQQAQARAAQAVASSGGVGALQAGTALGNTYQNLLSAQQQMATSLLGAGTPLISQAIQQQLSGTTTGINSEMLYSQQAGQAAAGMLGMLGKMFG